MNQTSSQKQINVFIRFADPADFPAMHKIYSWHIEHGTACLAWQAPNLNEFKEHLLRLSEAYPILAAVIEDKPGHQELIGYGYASRWLEKEAYQHAAELTVYFKEGPHYGLASKLLEKMEDLLRKQNIRHLISCTTWSNTASIRMQQDHGFQPFGFLPQAGRKNGSWHDVVWMVKDIMPPASLEEMAHENLSSGRQALVRLFQPVSRLLFQKKKD